MKIILPHKTLRITEKQKMMSDVDKVKFVNDLLQEEVEMHGQKTTLEMYLYETFNNPTSIVVMDMLSYFIAKEHRKYQDIMTRKTIRKMQRGDGRTINFTNLKYSDKIGMGLIDDVDSSNFN